MEREGTQEGSRTGTVIRSIRRYENRHANAPRLNVGGDKRNSVFM